MGKNQRNSPVTSRGNRVETMRVLQVNKFWYPRGGDCVVAMATAGLPRRVGHDVAVFTMAHPQGIADFLTPYL